MNLLQIQYFMTLAEELSFSKAAEKLYVTQPNVSMQISALEKEWDVQLFFRRYRGVSLTPSGIIMYKTIKEATSLFETGLVKARQNKGKQSIPISIGVPESANLGNMADLLAEYQQEHPEYRLTVEICPEAELLLTTVNGRFDIVLNQLFLLENAKELNIRLFSKSHFTIVISENHPLVKDNPDFVPAQLAEQNIIAYIPPSTNPERLIEHCKHICKSTGFTPSEVVLTPNVNSSLIAAKMCLGISVLDESVLRPAGSDLMFINTPVTTDMVFAWRKDSEKVCLEEIVDLVCSKMNISFAVI